MRPLPLLAWISPLQLEYVAPLGSSSLVFNFMFASILIVSSGNIQEMANLMLSLAEHTYYPNGYICTMSVVFIRTTVPHVVLQGTAVVIVGVIGIVAFGSINSGLKVCTILQHDTLMCTQP